MIFLVVIVNQNKLIINEQSAKNGEKFIEL